MARFICRVCQKTTSKRQYRDMCQACRRAEARCAGDIPDIEDAMLLAMRERYIKGRDLPLWTRSPLSSF